MRKRWWIVALAAVLAVVVAGGAVWYFVFRDDAPAEVSLDRAARSLDDQQSGTTATSGGTASSSPGSGLDGTWTVDQSIGSFNDFSSSYAGFRVQEQLVGIGAKTAVGRTPKVTGSMTLEGTTVPKASFDVDMTSLTTDDSRRDGAIRTQAIETARFPKATFVLTQPIQLGSIPADGEKIEIYATGDLTLHGVTKSVTIPLEAQRKGNVIVVIGSLEIPFADYSISQPRAASVLSVDDKGTFEVQLFFTRTT
jgi:polyisoprenoid-binding protein YceI